MPIDGDMPELLGSEGFYRRLEDRFRGKREDIKERLLAYVPFLIPLKEILSTRQALDLGCGRGEWLEVLGELGFFARGVDSDAGMLSACLDRGLDVVEGDAVEAMRGSAAASYAVVSGFHIIEHLPIEVAKTFIFEAIRCLAPGGLLILETPNPENLRVASTTFHLDPTHIKPVPAELLSYFAEDMGFARTRILRLNEDRGLTDRDVSLYDVLAGASPDYAIIAQKSGGVQSLPLDVAFAKEAGLSLDGLAYRYDQQVARQVKDVQSVIASQAAQQSSELQSALASQAARQTSELRSALANHASLQSRELVSALASQATLQSSELVSALASQAAQQSSELRSSLADQAAQLTSDFRSEFASHAVQQSQELHLALATQAEQQANDLHAALAGHSADMDLLRQRVELLLQMVDRQGQEISRLSIRLRAIEFVSLSRLFFRLSGSLRKRAAKLKRSIVRRLKGRTDRRASADMIVAQLPANTSAGDRGLPNTLVEKFNEGLARERLLAALQFVGDGRNVPAQSGPRPRLAFVSPLPPARTGIADYGAVLIRALSNHYEIDAISIGPQDAFPSIEGCSSVHDADWFLQNGLQYDRVLYHVGNSYFHSQVLDLLEKIPGIVVLHDFFLGDLMFALRERSGDANIWPLALYRSHGYSALKKLFGHDGLHETIREFPGNFKFLSGAQGAIFHNKFSYELALEFYPHLQSEKLAVVPLCRDEPKEFHRVGARRALKLADGNILVCSFGFLGRTKANHSLLEAWVSGGFNELPDWRLVFVGQIGDDPYGTSVKEFITRHQLKNVQITGYCSQDSYVQYLDAADIAVQLRVESRGETSATGLDCMSYGLPVIVNKIGSAIELPDNSVLKIDAQFGPLELALALRSLGFNERERLLYGQRAKAAIADEFSSRIIEARCTAAFEGLLSNSPYGFKSSDLVEAAIRIKAEPDEQRQHQIAIEFAGKFSCEQPQRQLLIDVSALVHEDLKTGIQRVTRAQLIGLLETAPLGFRVEPVYQQIVGDGIRLVYARNFTCALLDLPIVVEPDHEVSIQSGDIYFMPDLHVHAVITAANAGFYKRLRAAGVRVTFTVYDLLPILRADCFPSGTRQLHEQWISVLGENADGLICISETVLDDVKVWFEQNLVPSPTNLELQFLHLGADVDASKASKGLPDNSDEILKALSARPTFLSVGTVEPRKGYLQTLRGFEELWRDNVDVNLVIVGNEGWRGLPSSERRVIEDTVTAIQNNAELGRRLFWLNGISDEFLEEIYSASTCLIAASEAEGFGLPIVEAARHDVPIIARDIRVFREVAGNGAAYFSGLEPECISRAIINWLSDYRLGIHPRSSGVRWITWSEHVSLLASCLVSSTN